MPKSSRPDATTLEEPTVPVTATPGGALVAPPSADPDRIAQLAYERFLERGGLHGHDQEDWFEAEREVRRLAGDDVA